MSQAFHQWLPEWVHASLNNRSCSQCETAYSKNDIIAVGVRQLEDPAYAMYIEHQCSSCGFRALTTLGKQKEDTLERLCYTILESIKKRKLSEKAKMLQKNIENKPMTEKEVKNFINFMQTSESHDDFLREIGVTFPRKSDQDDPS
ncbi:MAG: hypothetical protein ACXAC5_00330 [Promethearchaeota archaeon]|jgi:predicted DNA-binding ribbon-helix-helix protein